MSAQELEQVVLATLSYDMKIQKQGEQAFNQAKKQPEVFFAALTQLLCGSQHVQVWRLKSI